MILQDKLLTAAELEIIIEQRMTKVFSKFIPELIKELTKKDDLVTTETVCKELKVTRQTLINWQNCPKKGEVMKPYCNKIGGKIYYNLNGLRKALLQNSLMFGHKIDTLAWDQIRLNRTYQVIIEKITRGFTIPDAEKKLYLEECEKRGDTSLLTE